MLYVYAPSVANGVGVEIGSAGLAYIHTELSHQHTVDRPGHTLCAATSPFTHTARNGAREIVRVYKSASGEEGCLNLDGGRPMMRASERESEAEKERRVGKEVNARCVVYSKACIRCEIFCKTEVENAGVKN